MKLDQLDTPSLLIDRERLLKNLADMQRYADSYGVQLRPHTKTHKMPAIAKLQLQQGACGVAAAKTGEAEVLVENGLQDVFIANEIVGEQKLRRIAALAARGVTISFGVDTPCQVTQAEQVFAAQNVSVPVLIEIEVGENRSGVIEEADFLTLLDTLRTCPHVIFGGIFSPTEASAVAVVYSLIISLFVYKDMSFKELPQVFVEGAVSTATIMVMVGLSSASSYVITTSGLPQQLVSFFSSITNSPVVILLLLNILFLIIGMLMEANAAVVMMTPILLPLLNAFGIDLLQFGIVMSFNLCIGLVTPPVGLCLLLCNQTGETRLSHSLKAMMPMLLISIIVLFLITYVSPLTTLLPSIVAG